MAMPPPPQLWLVPQLPSATGATLWFGAPGPDRPAPQVQVAWRSPAGTGSITLTPAWQAFEAGAQRFWYARAPLVGLAADRQYLLIASMIGAAPSAPATLRTLPRTLPPTAVLGSRFTLLLGSCFDYRRGQAGQAGALQFKLPAGDTPHLKLLCGDQVYLDLPWNEVLPRDDGELRARLLAKYLQNWGHGLQPGGQGYGTFLRWGANLFVSDDHEYWNNFPRWAAYVSSTFSRAAQDRLTDATRGLFRAFQADYRVAGAERCYQQIAVGERGEPGRLELMALDGRFGRTDRRACQPADMEALRSWVAGLTGPGVLVLSQPLFEPTSHWPGWSGLGDQGLADLDDYDELVRALAAARHDLLVLSGDIHGGRIAATVRGGRSIVEVVSSPIALCKPGKYHTSAAAKSFPARGIPGLAIHPVTTRAPLATQDQVAVLGLSRSDAGVDVVVQFWPVDGRSSRPLMTHNITLK